MIILNKSMVTAHIILAVLWISYCFIHSLLASQKIKKMAEDLWPSHYKYYRLSYSAFAFAGLVLILWQLARMGSFNVFNPSVFSYTPGIIIGASGIIIMAICIKKYFANLSGIRSLYKEEKPGSELIITGIHKHLRHPLYAGTFLFIWGLWLFFPFLSFLISNLIITVYTIIGIRWEEQKLEAEFGDSYRRYKQQVPKLIPSLKK